MGEHHAQVRLNLLWDRDERCCSLTFQPRMNCFISQWAEACLFSKDLILPVNVETPAQSRGEKGCEGVILFTGRSAQSVWRGKKLEGKFSVQGASLLLEAFLLAWALWLITCSCFTASFQQVQGGAHVPVFAWAREQVCVRLNLPENRGTSALIQTSLLGPFCSNGQTNFLHLSSLRSAWVYVYIS